MDDNNHDGDHVTPDDAVMSAVHIAAARARHGAPPAHRCHTCQAPATGPDHLYCDACGAEVDRMLDRTWPPVIE